MCDITIHKKPRVEEEVCMMHRKIVRFYSVMMILIAIVFMDSFLALSGQDVVCVGHDGCFDGTCDIRFYAINVPYCAYDAHIFVGYDKKEWNMHMVSDMAVIGSSELYATVHVRPYGVAKNVEKKICPLAEIGTLLCCGTFMFIFSTIYLRRKRGT